MNDGGLDICDAIHVKLISLPVFTNSSWLPRILAFDTVVGSVDFVVVFARGAAHERKKKP